MTIKYLLNKAKANGGFEDAVRFLLNVAAGDGILKKRNKIVLKSVVVDAATQLGADLTEL